jgi:outer membrane protein
LFNGFFNISEKKQALSKYKSSRFTYSRTEQQVIYNTILNYLDVVLSRELIRVGNENLNTQKLLLVRIKDFFNAGKKAVVDVHYQNAEIANSQYQLLNSEKGLKLAKVKLMNGMGLASDLNFDVIAPRSYDPAIMVDLEKEEIFDLAKKNRTDIRSAEFNIDAANHGLRSAKSGFYPRVSLTGNISSRYSSIANTYTFSDQLWNNNPSASIGVSVSIPVFDKGSTKNQVAQAKLDLENSKIDLVRINNQIWGDLIQAESNYRTALRQVEVANAKLEYSKIALESMTERYHVNASTITELSLVRAQYLQSQYDQVDAGLNLFKQAITLLYQIGDTEKMLALVE